MDALIFEKASDRERIERLIGAESAEVRRAIRRFLREATSAEALAEVRRAVERGNIARALDEAARYVPTIGDSLDRVFVAGGRAEVAAVPSRVTVAFNPTAPRAAAIMARNKLEFVRGFTRLQREATRDALERSLREGTGPRAAARAFRDSIGLTRTQMAAVRSYRALLESADRAALDRELRDRRSDRAVRRAADAGEPLGAARIAAMVERYRLRYIALRAETIARTETRRALGLARQEALEQLVERRGIPRSAVVRTWHATQDKRTRDTHFAMDGQERGMDTPFESPSGALLMYPGDPSAPAEEVINCRCVVTHSFR